MSKEKNQYHLFMVTRPSRNEEVVSEYEDLLMRQYLEEEWAKKIGVDVEQIKESGTESTSPIGLPTNCPTGTDTQGGNDIHSDFSEDDSNTRQQMDDIHNDRHDSQLT